MTQIGIAGLGEVIGKVATDLSDTSGMKWSSSQSSHSLSAPATLLQINMEVERGPG